MSSGSMLRVVVARVARGLHVVRGLHCIFSFKFSETLSDLSISFDNIPNAVEEVRWKSNLSISLNVKPLMKSLKQSCTARNMFGEMNIVHLDFSPQFRLTPLACLAHGDRLVPAHLSIPCAVEVVRAIQDRYLSHQIMDVRPHRFEDLGRRDSAALDQVMACDHDYRIEKLPSAPCVELPNSPL
jgi:hypothetical protein